MSLPDLMLLFCMMVPGHPPKTTCTSHVYECTYSPQGERTSYEQFTGVCIPEWLILENSYRPASEGGPAPLGTLRTPY